MEAPLRILPLGLPLLALLLLVTGSADTASAQGPEVLRPNLEVRTVVNGLVTPTTKAFIGPDDFLILEKNTGHVQRIVDGSLHSTVLDLAVNFASERGALGIALHPQFPDDPGVYIYWTESNTGSDTNVLSETPLLGNRVDRFEWDGSALTFDHNVIVLRAWQPSFAFPPFGVEDMEAERGNHDGGVIQFGPDGKLYVFIGDVGRRGWMQNVTEGRGPNGDDDQFGGPEPTDAHLTGVILRLNDDGSTPSDNPFFAVGSAMGGEVGENIQKVFSYGHRNSFGFDFDPVSGALWLGENGDDSFAEINRVLPGMNGGWIQIMGPLERLHEYRTIETGQWPGFPQFHGLQQLRWPPELIAETEEELLERLFMLSGAHYADPVYSWRFVVEPAGFGFLRGRALGPQYEGDLFLGGARDFLEDGHLFHIKPTGNRRGVAGGLVDDNFDKWTVEQSEPMLFGRGFGVVTDIKTAPNGNLFITSLSHGAVYEISRRPPPRGHGPAAHAEPDTGPQVDLPEEVTLSPNYPNPFTSSTMVRFGVLDEAPVRLEVFDLIGRRVAVLVDDVRDAGWHEVEFDASALPAGTYILRLAADAVTRTRPLVLTR